MPWLLGVTKQCPAQFALRRKLSRSLLKEASAVASRPAAKLLLLQKRRAARR
jgi:hypothetical protein